MDEMRQCTKCGQSKLLAEKFYKCSGIYRKECKQCTIKGNSKHQKKIQAWRYRYKDEESRKQYMREYYKKNPEKFAKYREEFREREPDYYRRYYRNKKEDAGE